MEGTARFGPRWYRLLAITALGCGVAPAMTALWWNAGGKAILQGTWLGSHGITTFPFVLFILVVALLHWSGPLPKRPPTVRLEADALDETQTGRDVAWSRELTTPLPGL